MTRVKYIVFMVLVAVLSGCRPKGILSSSKMREVMYDLHKTEAILQQCGYNYGHDEAVAKYYYVVLEKHGVTQAQFDSSLVWYTDHPDFGNKLYPKVVTRMEEEIAAMEQEIEERNRQRDGQPEEAPYRCIYGDEELNAQMHEYRTGLKPDKWDFYPLEEANVPFLKKNDEKE